MPAQPKRDEHPLQRNRAAYFATGTTRPPQVSLM